MRKHHEEIAALPMLAATLSLLWWRWKGRK